MKLKEIHTHYLHFIFLVVAWPNPHCAMTLPEPSRKEMGGGWSFILILWLSPTNFLGLWSHRIIFLNASLANSSWEWNSSCVFSASYSPSLLVIKSLQICQPTSDSKIFITGDDVRGKKSTAWVLDLRLSIESWCVGKKKHLTQNKFGH